MKYFKCIVILLILLLQGVVAEGSYQYSYPQDSYPLSLPSKQTAYFNGTLPLLPNLYHSASESESDQLNLLLKWVEKIIPYASYPMEHSEDWNLIATNGQVRIELQATTYFFANGTRELSHLKKLALTHLRNGTLHTLQEDKNSSCLSLTYSLLPYFNGRTKVYPTPYSFSRKFALGEDGNYFFTSSSIATQFNFSFQHMIRLLQQELNNYTLHYTLTTTY